MLELLLVGSKTTAPSYVKAFRLNTKNNDKALTFVRRNIKFYTQDSLGGIVRFDEGFPSIEVTPVVEYSQFVSWIDVYTLTTDNMPILQGSALRVYTDANDSITSVTDWDACDLNNVGFVGNAITSLPATLPPTLRSLTELISSKAFNQDLSTWDTSNVTSMAGMFHGCSAFNGSLANWDTSKVSTMFSMFGQCTNFNQPIAHFNTSKVEIMQGMFAFCQNFDQPINGWDTSKVKNMTQAFILAEKFNQPLDNWNTSSVTKMASMFSSAYAFNQDLSGWDVANVTDYADFATGSAMIGSNLPAFV